MKKKALLIKVVNCPSSCSKCEFFHLHRGGHGDHPSYCDLIPKFWDWTFEGDTILPDCPIIEIKNDNLAKALHLVSRAFRGVKE